MSLDFPTCRIPELPDLLQQEEDPYKTSKEDRSSNAPFRHGQRDDWLEEHHRGQGREWETHTVGETKDLFPESTVRV